MQSTETKEKILAAAGKYLGRYFTGKRSETDSGAVKRYLSQAALGVFDCGIAFLIASAKLKSGIMPFGSALLCASEKRVPFIFAGLALSAFVGGESAMINIVTYSAALVIRLLLCFLLGLKRGQLFTEPEPFRLSAAAASGFIAGIYSVFGGGFTKASLVSALMLIALTPAATYLYGGLATRSDISGVRRDAGLLSAVFTAVLGLSAMSIAGFSPAFTASVFLTLCAAAAGGAFRGGVVGMVCGLACSASLSPALGIAGVIAGTLRHTGTVLPMLAFCGCGTAFSLVAQGFEALGSTIPQLLWGAALFAPAAKLGLVPKIYPLIALNGTGTSSGSMLGKAIAEGRRGVGDRERLCALSDAFSSLSSVFYTMSNRISTPGVYEVRTLCEKSFKKYCGRCSRAPVCWGREYDRTADIMNKLANAVAKHGCADSEYIPDDFFRRCPNAIAAMSELNLSHARMLEAAARENKTEVFALDYEAMAQLLENAASESSEEYECDRALTAKLRNTARDIGLYSVGAGVYGKRRKTVVAGGVDISESTLSSAQIRSALEESLGMKLTPPVFTADDGYVTMTCRSARTVCVETASSSLKKESEEMNGDSAVCFTNREDRFYSLISDGMGSGREAAMTSRVTCSFLEKMLSSGNRKSIVLKMLNNFIRNKNLECFATVDLLEIDLLSGEAGFVKSGAAASYVIRGGKLFKIASDSLPIGITREITAEDIRFTLLPGDLVVMISDGVSQSFEDGVWLAGMLSELDGDSPLDAVTAKILDAAKTNNRRSDDMTVTAVRIGAEK